MKNKRKIENTTTGKKTNKTFHLSLSLLQSKNQNSWWMIRSRTSVCLSEIFSGFLACFIHHIIIISSASHKFEWKLKKCKWPLNIHWRFLWCMVYGVWRKQNFYTRVTCIDKKWKECVLFFFLQTHTYFNENLSIFQKILYFVKIIFLFWCLTPLDLFSLIYFSLSW